MAYGIKADMIGLEGWIVDCGDEWKITLDPSVATTFPTRKEAHTWGRDNMAQYDGERPFYPKTITKKDVSEFENWKRDGYLKGGGPKREPCVYNPDIHTNEDVLKFWVWHGKEQDRKVSYEDYQTWPEPYELKEGMEYVFNVVSFLPSHGEDEDNKRHSFTLVFRKDEDHNVKTFKDQIHWIVNHDYLKPDHVTEDGGMIFDVFDHYLSEGGNSVNFVYYDDDNCVVTRRYGEIIEGTVDECFDYLVRERYYD